MVNVSTVAHMFTIGTASWAVVAMLGVALFAAWPHIMGRRNDRRRIVEEEKAGDWSRLREENARLHKYLAECEEQRAALRDDLAAERNGRGEERAGRLEAEALLMARQKSDNEAQRMLSEGRQKDADARAKKDKPDG